MLVGAGVRSWIVRGRARGSGVRRSGLGSSTPPFARKKTPRVSGRHCRPERRASPVASARGRAPASLLTLFMSTKSTMVKACHRGDPRRGSRAPRGPVRCCAVGGKGWSDGEPDDEAGERGWRARRRWIRRRDDAIGTMMGSVTHSERHLDVPLRDASTRAAKEGAPFTRTPLFKT